MVWPHREVSECMACNHPVWVKNGKVVEVCTTLLRVIALRVQSIRQDCACKCQVQSGYVTLVCWEQEYSYGHACLSSWLPAWQKSEVLSQASKVIASLGNPCTTAALYGNGSFEVSLSNGGKITYFKVAQDDSVLFQQQSVPWSR